MSYAEGVQVLVQRREHYKNELHGVRVGAWKALSYLSRHEKLESGRTRAFTTVLQPSAAVQQNVGPPDVFSKKAYVRHR